MLMAPNGLDDNDNNTSPVRSDRRHRGTAEHDGAGRRQLGGPRRWLNLASTGLAFLGSALTPWILTALALAELVADKLPTTPSRKAPLGFGARIVTGAFSGAALGAAGGSFVAGAIAGAIGAVIDTFGGHASRARLAASFGRDRPAALIEDAVAIGGALLIMAALK